MAKNILVMGVGRSGTTAIYSLLQEILGDALSESVDYVYEPFLWDRKIFNKPYTEITTEFRTTAALSVDGMYHNQSIPLFMKDASTTPELSHSWLQQTLSPSDGKRHFLGKIIRANGRMPVIRAVSRDSKIIFIIRNPVDVLNSALQSFSFHGSEFHASDYPRFVEEVSSFFQGHPDVPSEGSSNLEKEYLYWYYSNLAFLRFAKSHPENILTLSHEYFVAHGDEIVEQMCGFLDIEFKEEYAGLAKHEVGPVRRKQSSLTFEGYDFLQGKLDKYRELLDGVMYSPVSEIGDFVRFKRERCNDPSDEQGLTELFNSYYANVALRKTSLDLENSRAMSQSQATKLEDLRARLQKVERAQKLLRESYENTRDAHQSLGNDYANLKGTLNELGKVHQELIESHNKLKDSRRLRIVNQLLYPFDRIAQSRRPETKED